LTSALDRVEWSASRLGRFTPREGDLGIHWIAGWVIAANFTRLTHKIEIQLPLVAESFTFAVIAPGGQFGNF